MHQEGWERAWIEFVAGLLREPVTDWPHDDVASQLRTTFALQDCRFERGFPAQRDPDATCRLRLPLAPEPRGPRGFVLLRTRPFDERDRDRARVILGLLRSLDVQIGALATARARTRSDDPAAWAELTRRERAVLDRLATGDGARVIARELAITERTVHKHLERVYAKLGVSDRLSAVLEAQRRGLVGAPMKSA